LIALGINNGWYDPIIQYKAYVDFSYNNTYTPLITASQHTSYLNTYTSKCLPLLEKCTSVTGSNSACENADNTCYNDIEGPLSEVADFDVYDIREPSNDPYPPETYVTYLQSSAVMSAIGAKSTYAECPDAPYEKFANTGDGASLLFPKMPLIGLTSGRCALLPLHFVNRSSIWHHHPNLGRRCRLDLQLVWWPRRR
jgi:carboxypeptidase C (cathepsin A)